MAMTHDYLDHLNETIGISPANSQEELQAAQVISEVMSRHDVEPRIEDFDAPAISGLTGAVLGIIMFVGILISGFGILPLTIVGFILAAIPAVRSIMRLFGRELPLSFGPRAQSQNVVAVHRATGPLVTKGSRTIVVAAHYDSPRENFLNTSPLAPYLTFIHKIQVPCSFVVLFCAFIQILVFLPSVVCIVLWIVGIIAALPALITAVGAIAECTAPCTLGANDNKAAVAAMLGVLQNVRPSGEVPHERPKAPPVPEEPTAPEPEEEIEQEESFEEEIPAEAAEIDAPAETGEVEIPAETEPMLGVEPMPGTEISTEIFTPAAESEALEADGTWRETGTVVRHGESVLRSLGILPESCEIVYIEAPRETSSTIETPAPQAPVSRPAPSAAAVAPTEPANPTAASVTPAEPANPVAASVTASVTPVEEAHPVAPSVEPTEIMDPVAPPAPRREKARPTAPPAAHKVTLRSIASFFTRRVTEHPAVSDVVVRRPAPSAVSEATARPASPSAEPTRETITTVEEENIAPEEPSSTAEPVDAASEVTPEEADASADETAQTTRADLLATGSFITPEEEGYGVGPKDTTGVMTLADDATAAELEATAPTAPVNPPAAPSDPEWGKTSYRPQLSSAARRASLYDLPDPSGEEIDPFDTTDPGATRIQTPQIPQTVDAEHTAPAPEPLSMITSDDLDEESSVQYQEEEKSFTSVIDTLKGLFSRFKSGKAASDDEVENEVEGVDDSDSGADDDGWRGGAATRGGLRLVGDVEDVPSEDELRDAVLKLGDDALIAHDIWFVALGGSSLDHAGMKSFLAAHRSEIRGCFVVNLDCVGAGDLTILRNEGLEETRRGDRRITRLLTGAATDLHMDLSQAPHDWDDTDATPAMRSSLRSVTIMGLDENGLPALSHTPDDVPDNVDGDQAADVAALVTEMIRRS